MSIAISRSRVLGWAGIASIALVGACSDDTDPSSNSGPQLDSIGAGTSATTDGTATDGMATAMGGTQANTSESLDSSDSGGGVKFDLPPPGDIVLDDGCAAVDFLFVIDNSISMQDQQNALKAAFPGFIEAIQNSLPTTDYHIMVADTDAEGRCSPGTCNHNTCQEANQYACGNGFEACDTIRGAGVIHPAGQGASNMLCQIQGGNRYIQEGQPDLEGTFECIASVGLAGHPSERPLDGIVEAVSAPLNAPGGCNEGFLRDDGILVVTFISDDPNLEDENTTQQAYDAVVAAKNGNPDAVVVLGLIPGNQPQWSDFIVMFGERGIEGPVSGGDYDQFFLDAVSTIEDTCLDFEG